MSASAHIVWPSLERLSRRTSEPIRVLDIATGGGDIPIALWRRAKRSRLPIEISACDFSRRAIEVARRRAEKSGAEIEFFSRDVLAEPLPDGFDAIICSLFLHHLSDDDAASLLGRMAEASRRLVLVNDLRRSTPGLLLAYGATKLVTRSDVVRVDGPLSVRAAFTIAEAKAIACRAGLDDCDIRPRWPFRFLLSWWRHDRS
ncbi:MAG TPA: methyltransferase domain-containing protein [Pirellulales bacterium]|nr:methyltransferase domain-containing protein [Pirellulales bacterium]